jgi:hypothetical protein
MKSLVQGLILMVEGAILGVILQYFYPNTLNLILSLFQSEVVWKHL